MYFKPKRIVIVGLGGIGSNLVSPLLRWNEFTFRIPVVLIDGDHVENKNLERQSFYIKHIGKNKAKALASLFRKTYSFLIEGINSYLDESNVEELIKSDDIVLIGVDNYKTRVVIQQYVINLPNIFCIFMGNEYIDGDILCFLRVMDKNLTLPIWEEHPELIDKEDKIPSEMSCEELLSSDPQIIFTNLMASVYGLNFLYNFFKKKITKGECYFDIEKVEIFSSSYNLIGENKELLEER